MEKEKKESKLFNGFTNLYEVQKTLRFELKPVGNTQKMLDEAYVFEKDRIIKEKYNKTKQFIDRIHREFVNESLEGVSLIDLKKYFTALEDWKNDKKNKEIQKSLKKEEERLRKEIVNFFNKTAENWVKKKYPDIGLKKKDIGILFEESVFEILKKRYGNEEDSFLQDENGGFLKDENDKRISIFDEWKGFVGYFTKFQETRKNFYKDDGTETAIATRIVNQNLKRFCDNLEDFKKIKSKIADFLEVEKSFDKLISEIFSLNFYNQCLLQDGINFYNEILGGKNLDNGKKLRGINEIINEYRQKNKSEKIPFLKLLDKQILSEKGKFLIGIENDEKLFETLKIFYKMAEEKIKIVKTLFSDFVLNSENYDLNKIYISKEAFNTIVYKWIVEARKFEELLYDAMKSDKPTGLNYDKKEGGYKFPNFIALNYLKIGLENIASDEMFWKEKYYKDKENKEGEGFLDKNENAWKQFLQIFNFEFNSLFESEIINKKGEKNKIGYDVFKKDFESLINQKNFSIKNTESKIIIKNFADNVLLIYQMAKYFAVEKKRAWVEEYDLGDFYTNPENGYLEFYKNAYENIVQVYNDLRNYLTKKPYSVEKWKLNFENPTLANGWDKNKESDNSAVILRKGGRYYLGLMRKGNNKIFDDRNKNKFTENIKNGKYEKMVYKYAKDISLGIPKSSTQVKDVANHFHSSINDYFLEEGSSVGKFIKPLKIAKRIFELNNRIYFKDDLRKSILRNNVDDKVDKKKYVKLFQKEFLALGGEKDIYKKALFDWINFCKDFLAVYPSCIFFDYSNIKSTQDYRSIEEFYKDVDMAGYIVSFQDISENYINQKNKNGEFYLFEIYNQDFAKGKTGNKNLHTLYFENLFSNENISKNFPVKLNGQAELFFRLKSIEVKPEKRKFPREIISKKRYSEDKIFFHCPITLNRETGSIFRFNDYVNNFLADNKNINIIGIDRGEKHLAYYSVIDQSGKIIKIGSLNTVKGIEYASKLEKKAGDREQARKDWQEVEGIKDMKKGYISQVIKELAELAIKYNAIIVLEDLNMRFKQIRGGIEKSIYQQLEKAFIEKLNFLVNKGEKNPEQAGHLLRAYQLTAPFTSFNDMGKQTGIIFYTQANYTSKTCPQCGFRKNNNKFYFENNIEKAKDVLRKMKSFEYNDKNQCFNLSYCLSDFANKEEIERNKNKKRDNVLFSEIEKKDLFKINTKDAIRYRWHDKNTERAKNIFCGESVDDDVSEEIKNTKRGVAKEYNITKCLIGLFESEEAKKIGLDYKQNLLEKLVLEKFSSDFYKRLFGYLNLIFEIRNSISGTNVDYISCPECGFNSSGENNKLKGIENGDANGAYNIARKGIMVLKKLSQFKKNNGSFEKLNWGHLFIDIEEWDKFTQIAKQEKLDISPEILKIEE